MMCKCGHELDDHEEHTFNNDTTGFWCLYDNDETGYCPCPDFVEATDLFAPKVRK